MTTIAPIRPAIRRSPIMFPTRSGQAAANQNPPEPPLGVAAAEHDEGPSLLVMDVKTMIDPEMDCSGELAGEGIAKPMYHRITAIAFLRARIRSGANGERLVVEECRAGGRADTSEVDLLTGFWRRFEIWKPKLVTFNGRGFALPVLKYRSMRHRLSAKYLHAAGDRWSGYGNRYALSHHVDLMDALSDHRASPFPSLKDLARSFRLPHHKEDSIGCDPAIADARVAAELDAATIFLGYIRWRLFTGEMTVDAHDAAAHSLRELLAAKSDRPDVARYLEDWAD